MADLGQLGPVYIAIAMLLMIASGTSKRMIAWKRTPRRRCDGCHHDVRQCTCRN